MKAKKFEVKVNDQGDQLVYLDGERVHGVVEYSIHETAEGFSEVGLKIRVDTAEAEVEDPEVETDFDLALPKLVQIALLQTLQEKLEDEPPETS